MELGRPWQCPCVLVDRGAYLSVVDRDKLRREEQPAYEAAPPDGETRVLTCVCRGNVRGVATKPPHSMLSGTSQGFLTIVRVSSARTVSCTN